MGTLKRDKVKKEIENLSAGLSADDAQKIFYDIVFKKKVAEGLKEADEGKGVPFDDLEKRNEIMVEVEIMPSAIEDIKEIIDYVYLQSVQNAEKLYTEIISKINSLKNHPETGRIVKEFADPKIRETKIYHFRIIYKLSVSKVQVITIHHSARLLSGNPNAKNIFE